MSSTRLLILGIGFVAAIMAAVLAVNLTTPNSAPQTVQKVIKVPTIETAKILVAAKQLNRGDKVAAGDLIWAEWPKSSITEKQITQSAQPDADETFTGSTVRLSMEAGDPASSNKLVEEGRGFMAALLEKGKRAVSTNVSPETAAGGFILPDDRVDVLMTRAVGSSGNEVNQNFNTVPVLSNIRVLAIDQEIQEKDGVPVVVGKTATLELDEEQARILAVTQRSADQITLALRSLRDAEEPATSDGAYLVNDGNNISIVRYGNRTTVKANQ